MISSSCSTPTTAPPPHSRHQRPSNRLLPRRELQRVEELERRANLQPHHVRKILPTDADRQRLRTQPRPAARRTQVVRPPAAQEHSQVHLVLPPLEPAEQAGQ